MHWIRVMGTPTKDASGRSRRSGGSKRPEGMYEEDYWGACAAAMRQRFPEVLIALGRGERPQAERSC